MREGGTWRVVLSMVGQQIFALVVAIGVAVHLLGVQRGRSTAKLGARSSFKKRFALDDRTPLPITYRSLAGFVESGWQHTQKEAKFMRKRLLAVTAALALMVGGLVVTASPANAHCSGHGTHPDRYSAGRIDWGNGTAIRSQPHIGCSVRGRGYTSHGIDVHCIVRTGAWWFYARNTTTGVNGWAREDALNINYPITIPVCSSAAATSSDASTPETVTLTG